MGATAQYDRWLCNSCHGVWLPICFQCNSSEYHGRNGARAICTRCDGQEHIKPENPAEDSTTWFQRVMGA